MLESLLGPIFTEFDRLFRCALIFRDGEVPFVPEPGPAELQNDFRSGDDCADELANSVGVGGVLTMTGAGLSPVGGVRGGSAVSTFGCTLDRLSVAATLAAAGGSIMGGTFGGLGSAPGVACCSLGLLGGGRESASDCRSGLELLELFFPLKMPLNLPPGEGDRRLGLCGGSKLVLLRRTRSSLDSTETDRFDGKVDDLEALLLESTSVAGD